jgi:hypothetical protein
MTVYADLEIALRRSDAQSHAVELRYSRPADEQDVRDEQDGVHFDLEGLRQLALSGDFEAYGRCLGEDFFGIEKVRKIFDQVQALDQPVRMRLLVGPSAPELHNLLWETMPDPTAGAASMSLATSERIVFSRYLSSQEWRRAQLRRKSDLRALVVVANPTDLGRFRAGDRPEDPVLEPINVQGELDRAIDGLKPIPVTELASKGTATLNSLMERLRDGCDILYLVCHGAVIEGEPKLWLEAEDGTADVVTGSQLVTGLKQLEEQPRLVVLVSCQSAGASPNDRTNDRGALVALGPRLASAGIPAVLAMRSDVTMQTVAEFMPAFFTELRRSGQVDRAVSVARGVVSKRPDAWMPVLFTRLRSGRIWYVPGFVTGPEEPPFDGWPALVNNIDEGNCTVILGSGLLEAIIGSTRAIACRWAEKHHFPLATYDEEDLPQVAQYLATQQDDSYLRRTLRDSLREEIQRRFSNELPGELKGRNAPLVELFDAVGSRLRQEDPLEPHNVLSHLPFPIYVTTNPENMLFTALETAGKHPRREVFPWNASRLAPTSDESGEDPTSDRPLVYHLFGHLDVPNSLVLTEDNFLDYLIGATVNRDLIPPVVRSALTDKALLFLGFQMTDWDFRVLFRSIVSQEGRAVSSEFKHVAVQIDPEDDRVQDTERARRYLSKYFSAAGIGKNPSIYWGGTADFVRELRDRWIDEYREDPTSAAPAEAVRAPA